MKIIAPSYYKKFKCIADKCRHSCCVDWEIDIDCNTYEKYKSLNDEYGKRILASISECGDMRCFILEKGRCPHLDSNGLCKIISAYGEDMLSDICKEHPRFYNDLGTHIEVGIGMVCEEAARLILTDDSFELAEIDNSDDLAKEHEFDPLPYRSRIFEVLSENSPLCVRIEKLKSEFNVSPDIYSFDEWIAVFSELEILSEKWKKLLKGTKLCEADPVYDVYFERFLKYLVFRHISSSESYEDLRARLGFVLVSEMLVRNMVDSFGATGFDDMREIFRLYSSEIEYSEDNSSALIFEFESVI